MGVIGGVFGAFQLVVTAALLKRSRDRRIGFYHQKDVGAAVWQRKRSLVLGRDRHKCRLCGAPATQIDRSRYAVEIGREPVEWLISLCPDCSLQQHAKYSDSVRAALSLAVR